MSLLFFNSCLDKDLTEVEKLGCYVNTLDYEQLDLFIKKISHEKWKIMLELLSKEMTMSGIESQRTPQE